MELYALFPTDEELQNAKPGVRQRLEAWVAAHPALVKRFPANALLSHFQGALEQIRH
jgi:hypothetical protein